VHAAENLSVLIRQMEEMWLFSKLDTLESNDEEKHDELVAEFVTRLASAAAAEQRDEK
jgi:hypothetical protein